MSEQLHELSIATLIHPIQGGTGEDLSFSDLFDQIKEARREDAPYLSQGDWQAELKKADWDEVIRLSSDGLTHQCKDLRLVAWLCEGLAHKYEFEGIAFGLSVCEAILREFWADLFPALDEDIEVRSERLAWMNNTLAGIAYSLPLTQDPAYGLIHHDESLMVDNLGRQSDDAIGTAIAEGKITSEMFNRSAVLTSNDHLHARFVAADECIQACSRLQAQVDQVFEEDVPHFLKLEETLVRVSMLAKQLLAQRGEGAIPVAARVAVSAPAKTVRDDRVPSIDPPVSLPATSAVSPLRVVPLTREEAFTQLRGVVQFFKQTEPHSPVPMLIERAIRWGDMPLETWLSDVIKDGGVLEGIREVLGTQRP